MGEKATDKDSELDRQTVCNSKRSFTIIIFSGKYSRQLAKFEIWGFLMGSI